MIAYDIADAKRLRRVRRYLVKRATAVQYSIFEAWLTGAERQRLLRGLTRLIDAKADDVRLYPMPPSAPRTESGPRLLPDGVLIIDGAEAKAGNPPGRRRGKR